MQNNFVFNLLNWFNFLLIILAIVSVLTATFSITLIDKMSKRLHFFGHSLLTLAVFLSCVWTTLNFILVNHLTQIIEKINFFQDGKLVNGLQKFVAAAISRQTTSYVVEIIVLSILSIILVFVAKSESSDSGLRMIQIIDGKQKGKKK